MNSSASPSTPSTPTRGGTPSTTAVEVFYDRMFILDLHALDPVISDRIRQFVFSDVFQTKHLHFLPDFRQMGTSQIFYRFTLEDHLISLEVTGQIIKFLRVLPKPVI
ncbi:MAG: hypothetical protein VKJ24_16505 [Synechococcales bacterium]|nr:hypothetical protein [Synechococcales bacterium]